MTIVHERIARLREKLVAHNLDYWLVTRGDAFQHELIDDSEKRLKWLTGFSGSAGFVIVGREEAGLFVDGRYEEQAHEQCQNTGITVLEMSAKAVTDFLGKKKGKLGVDGRFITRKGGILSSTFLEKRVAELSLQQHCLIEDIWQDRPVSVYTRAWNLDGEKSQEQLEERIKRIRALRPKEAAGKREGYFIAGADTACWLLGVRGADIKEMPIVLSRALLVLADDDWHIYWYIEGDMDRVEGLSLLQDKISIRSSIQNIIEDAQSLDQLWLDPQCTNEQIYSMCTSIDTLTVMQAPSIVRKVQTIKTIRESRGFRDCHIRDGAMMVKLLYWIDRKKEALDELTIIEKIHALRQQTEGYIGQSFSPIVGSGSNGSIIHYRSTAKSNRKLRNGELLLIDCGGHYRDGTTDVTRTIAIETVPEPLARIYTFVLKAHIRLMMQIFPKKTLGSELDTVARHVLWNEGMDYPHGTGHGVGHVLAVHESPPTISRSAHHTHIDEGMVLSIEPGYYRSKEFGCRIENLAIVHKTDTENLAFENYTCVPYDRRLILKSLLTEEEKEWLDAYHAWVEYTLAPLLSEEEHEWLQLITKPI